MSNMEMFGLGSWTGVVSAFLLVASFYFTLTFFEQLKSQDARLTKQAKIAAVICLVIALLLPAVYQLYFVNEMMR
ncbi:hypothetical protein [Planococcus maritimus]|uniref:hypothetical protein n=1 Tax=Planococcus maritimus TaxID=192421 RepID=UPI0007997C91|nr:hypothetical protein [Planococcus maritimus]KYG60143.1 hypothetical protein AY633_07920 [Planococcus maritimus]